MIGKAFVAHVNARSSNHDPNHVLNHVPKRLSERDSSPCKHTHCLPIIYALWIMPHTNRWTLFTNNLRAMNHAAHKGSFPEHNAPIISVTLQRTVISRNFIFFLLHGRNCICCNLFFLRSVLLLILYIILSELAFTSIHFFHDLSSSVIHHTIMTLWSFAIHVITHDL